VKHKILLLLFLTVCPFTAVIGALQSVDIESPRAFGYVIGDVFTHRITIVLDDAWELEQDSLPKSGRASIWLDLTLNKWNERQSEATTEYVLELEYQVFNAPEGTVEVSTPALELTAIKGEKSLPIIIPEWQFNVASVTPIDLHESLDYLDLQPAILPYPYETTKVYALLALGILGLLACAAALSYAFDIFPEIRTQRGPFSRALKKLRSLNKLQPNAESSTLALRRVHQAFNETAGKVLMADDLDGFFSQFPLYQNLQEPIEGLFGRSRKVFFELGTKKAADNDIRDLLDLCRHCRDVERGLT